MARRRMIEVSIAHDEHFNTLSEFEQLVFLRILPHTDDVGRFSAHPDVIKARTFPFTDRPSKEFAEAVMGIMEVGLVSIYQVEDKIVMQFKEDSFRRINAVLVKNSEGKSEYPAPVNDEYLTSSQYLEFVNTWQTRVKHVPARALKSKEYKAESSKQKVESKESKVAFGEFGNVFLTDVEYGRLVQRLGTTQRARDAIEILSAYKKSKNKKYDSDYATFTSWVIGELEKRENGNGTHQHGGSSNNQTRPSPTLESAQRTLEKTERRIAARNRPDNPTS